MKKLFLFASAIALVFASCSNDEDLGGSAGAGDGAIEFRTLMDKPSSNLRTAITDETSILSFTLTGIRTGGDYNGEYLFNGEGITRGEDGKWNYNPKRYWPKGEKIDFYAYSPSSSKNVTVGITDYTSAKSITYTVPQISNKDAQEDFLVARSMQQNGGTNGTDPVVLNFHHALSRVMFFARTTQENVTYTIDKVELVNLNETGTLNLSGIPEENSLTYPCQPWTDQSSFKTYAVDRGESPAYLLNDYASVLGQTNAVMVLPQATTKYDGDGKTVPGTGKFAVKVSYKAFAGGIYYAGTATKSAEKYFAVNDPSDVSEPITFEMGRQYNFYLEFGDEVGKEINFSVRVSNWTENAPGYLPELNDYRSVISADLLAAAGWLTGAVTKADLLSKTSLTVKNSSVKTTDFTGLEYFENITKLTVEDATGGSDLDASKNAKLNTVEFYSTINLGTVNLSNTALTTLKFGSAATIKNLDVSNTRITEFGGTNKINLAAVTITGTLNMSNCGLTEVPMPNDASITIPELNLSNNNIETLTIRDCKIETLNIENNAKLTNLIFAANTAKASSYSKKGDKIEISNVSALGNKALQKIEFENSNYGGILLKKLDIQDSKNIKAVNPRFSFISELVLWTGCTRDYLNGTGYGILNVASGSGAGEISKIVTADGTVIGQLLSGQENKVTAIP
ncbi:hypothetical protein M2132_001703 [Dysgonomonas sp. PH5-45]|uniref:fimbrillin family protein n=1 Tax=unclassified Dysgonomonas TaxID=2630389 RepID=UPI00247435BF|nr:MULTISPECIES: fimbrillin family protein [unclassified Dysgonomonas]MDH6355362.1 hypothetical protein [Dysgonomonas sp. PH5-45]MDH6388260.1 hypothetical protein [Dysgonomonas sp. PH5-37]